MQFLDDFLQSNSKWLIILIFSAGLVYSEFQGVKRQQSTLERRLENKINIINEQDDVIHDLELRLTRLETTPCTN